MWRREGRPSSRLLSFLSKQPQDSFLFQSRFFSSSFCLLLSFPYSILPLILSHTQIQCIDNGGPVCSFSWILRRSTEETCGAVKENSWWVTHQYKSLVQRLSLNMNGNWSEIPEVNERNDIIGAHMDKVKEKNTTLFYWSVMYSAVWCTCLGLTCCSYVLYVCLWWWFPEIFLK